ncbi:hypothetical protein [Mesorhizobium sp. L-8-3]|uniref:hypothetical protein n=1 Tax=Mesorhizobium sp. L-8-3 TaxID=2744522 RepID=UPI001FD43733|nr:hypothetical protein [Mesorhizobium sp. L-8-3]
MALPLLAAYPAAPGNIRGKAHIWRAGAYSFSDELGGLRILGVSGSGRKEDPFVVRQEFTSSSPAIMVIRAAAPIRPFDQSGAFASGFMHMRVVVVNNSGQAWVEFEFELQELYLQPSVFGDGLSFDQRRSDSDNISSDSFAQFSRDFEPYDRLRFRDGKVDPLATAGFSFLITDFTPRSQFYLLQDPRIPSS